MLCVTREIDNLLCCFRKNSYKIESKLQNMMSIPVNIKGAIQRHA